jgi:preprotein translocase subunit SecG
VRVLKENPALAGFFVYRDLDEKQILMVLVFTLVIAGLGVVLGSQSFRIGDSIGSLKGMNARTMAFIALPFIFIIYFIVNYLRKKNEDRKWKQAILRTRSMKHDS